jgi:hypothetical protein
MDEVAKPFGIFDLFDRSVARRPQLARKSLIKCRSYSTSMPIK